MNRTWLELIFPASLALLTVTNGVFLLSMTGLLEPAARHENDAVASSECAGPKSIDAVINGNSISTAGPEIVAGNALFLNNCAQCHAVHDKVVGPALAGINKRRPEKWLLAWVKNSSKMVASDDLYAVKIFNDYQQQQMPSFQLSNQEIQLILQYVEWAAAREPIGTDNSGEIVACR